jgi:hypothetical protein
VARYVLIVLFALAAAGCVRIHFDLCDEDPPHPECMIDGAVDAGPDGGDGG